MKVINKITSLATVVALCVTFATTAFAANGAISLSADKTTFAPGETFDVKINITSNPGFIMGQLCAGVPEGLTLTNAVSSNVYGAGSFSTNYKDGYLFMLGDEGAEANYTVTGHAATLTYKISDTASGTYTINVYQYPNDTFYNVDYDEINFDSATLTITVAGGDDEVKANKTASTNVDVYTFENSDDMAGKRVLMTKATTAGSTISDKTRFKVTYDNQEPRIFGSDIWDKLAQGAGSISVGTVKFGIVVTDNSLDAAKFTFEVITLD